eukprot:GHVU01037268.1.p1 GENE.GHVU01037268.1~~GHVU01037268.1.p1  ORF type:complete len:304 (-),score=53.10 GHVU01037268.1:392-1303(-)
MTICSASGAADAAAPKNWADLRRDITEALQQSFSYGLRSNCLWLSQLTPAASTSCDGVQGLAEDQRWSGLYTPPPPLASETFDCFDAYLGVKKAEGLFASQDYCYAYRVMSTLIDKYPRLRTSQLCIFRCYYSCFLSSQRKGFDTQLRMKDQQQQQLHGQGSNSHSGGVGHAASSELPSASGGGGGGMSTPSALPSEVVPRVEAAEFIVQQLEALCLPPQQKQQREEEDEDEEEENKQSGNNNNEAEGSGLVLNGANMWLKAVCLKGRYIYIYRAAPTCGVKLSKQETGRKEGVSQSGRQVRM